MAKYRLLSLEELQELEKEFINYLILNGIAAEDWEKMKKENKPSAEKIVELFSDVVFETIFRKVEFLEYRTATELRTFQCLKDKIVLVGLKAPEESTVNFTELDSIKHVLESSEPGFKIYSSEKKYNKVREEELFDMTNQGCYISDGKLFKALCLVLPNQK